VVCCFYKVKLLLLRGKVVVRKAILFVLHNRVEVFSLLRPEKWHKNTDGSWNINESFACKRKFSAALNFPLHKMKLKLEFCS